jgi:hypothetical protein
MIRMALLSICQAAKTVVLLVVCLHSDPSSDGSPTWMKVSPSVRAKYVARSVHTEEFVLFVLRTLIVRAAISQSRPAALVHTESLQGAAKGRSWNLGRVATIMQCETFRTMTFQQPGSEILSTCIWFEGTCEDLECATAHCIGDCFRSTWQHTQWRLIAIVFSVAPRLCCKTQWRHVLGPRLCVIGANLPRHTRRRQAYANPFIVFCTDAKTYAHLVNLRLVIHGQGTAQRA